MENHIIKSNLLVKLKDDELVELAKIYENVTWAPHVVCFIHTVIKLKNDTDKNRDYGEACQFYSFDDCWRIDGTIIVTMLEKDIFYFTLDEKCENLAIALRSCTFKPLKLILFYCIHEKFVPLTHKVLEEKHFEVQSDHPCRMYTISPESAANFQIDCPPDVYIKKLDQQSAEKINSVWPFRTPGSVKHIETIIRMNDGFGLFRNHTNELVAWVLTDRFGHMGMLQTDENYRRRGYAEIILKYLAKIIGKEGHWPFGTIVTTNHASMSLFSKLGFIDIGMSTFFIILPQSK